jgi:hypothetical protein
MDNDRKGSVEKSIVLSLKEVGAKANWFGGKPPIVK